MSSTVRLTLSRPVFRMSGTGSAARLTAPSPVVQRLRVNSPSNIGATGPAGPAGPAGPGVAAGGTVGQVLKKQSATDYDTDWEDEAGGLADAPSDGTTYGRRDGAWVAVVGQVISVNGQTGVVVLDTDDIAEGSNLYYTEARVAANTDVAANTAARHTHANQAQLDLITDGDHDVRTDNPHTVTKAQVGLSNVTNDAQLKRSASDFSTFPNKTADLFDQILVEDLTTGAKYYYFVRDLPTQDAVTSALALKSNVGHMHTAIEITDFNTAVASTALLKANNLSDVVNQQAALNTLTAVAGATDEYVLTKDTGTGNALWKAAAGGGAVSSVFGRTGAVIAATNDYTWAQVDKTVSSLADITTRSHTALTDIGTNTHAQIDTHIASVANPHAVTKAQVGLSAVLNAVQIRNATNSFTADFAAGTPATTSTIVFEAAAGSLRRATLNDLPVSSATTAAIAAHAALTATHGATGAVVGTTNTQTLTNKTLTTPTIADFTNAQHAHAGASSGGQIAHSSLTGVGTNTHAQIDTHIALVSEHIDWTNASANFQTTGYVAALQNTLATRSSFFADLNIPVSGFDSSEINGIDIDIDAAYAAGALVATVFRGIRYRFDLTDAGASFIQPTVQIIDGRINAGGKLFNSAIPPMYYELTNPISTQDLSNGFMRVAVTGGSGAVTTVAFYSLTNVSGAGNGIAYRGHVGSVAGTTGSAIGVQGYAVPHASSNHSEIVALDGQVIGGTALDKKMSIRGNCHALIRGGSGIFTNSATPATPSAVTTTHLDFLNNRGELYAQGNAEFDGEVFHDGNESHSVVDVSSTPHSAGAATYIMVDATTTNHVENLPAISGLSGNREYVVKKVDASGNTVTVTANGSDTIDGSGTFVLSAQYDVVRLIAGNGTEWHVV